MACKAGTGQPSLPFEPVCIFVRHPRARRYVIRVAGDGTVRVTVPRWGSKREAVAFVEQEYLWIEQQQQQRRLEQVRRCPQLAPRDAEVQRELRTRARRE